jgi:hypothetical protein
MGVLYRIMDIRIPSELPSDQSEKSKLLSKLKELINQHNVVDDPVINNNNIYVSSKDMACDPCDNIYNLLKGTKMSNDETGRFYVIPKTKIITESQEVSGGSKRRYKRKSTKKKKVGAVPIHSQSTVLQSASYAPSLDNSFLSQSTLVGGKKKRTQRKRKSLKKKSRKH